MAGADTKSGDIREEALAHFSELLGLEPLARIVQRGRDPETARFTFYFENGGGEIRIGTVKQLWSQSELGRILLVSKGVVPDPVKSSEWKTVLAGVARYCLDVEEVEGERFDDAVTEWLQAYLDTAALDVDRDGAAAQGVPFHHDGDLHLTVGHFAKYVRREFSEQVQSQHLRQALTDLGFERKTINYQRPQKARSTKSYYVIAQDDLTLDGGG